MKKWIGVLSLILALVLVFGALGFGQSQTTKIKDWRYNVQSNRAALQWSAKTSEEANGTLHLTGVEVKSERMIITADEADFITATHEGTIRGNVHFKVLAQ
jgi:hypothetical protein